MNIDRFSNNYQTIEGNYGYADLKANGSLKVSISKRKDDGTFERDSFVISKDSLKEICSLINPRHSVTPVPSTPQSFTLEQKKEEQGFNAYEPWTKEEEEELSNLFTAGIPVPEIARRHHQGTGAIQSRLRKIGLG